jgi:hypothetical protein
LRKPYLRAESREEAQEDGYVVFLVPAIDPTDEDIDDM